MKRGFPIFTALCCAIVLAGVCGCSNLQERDSATVSFTFDSATLSKLTRTSARTAFDITADAGTEATEESAQEPSQQGTFYMTIALLGGYNASQTKKLELPTSEAAESDTPPSVTFTFNDIKVGTSLYARALFYLVTADETAVVYYGSSDSVTIDAGTNALALPMTYVRNDEPVAAGLGSAEGLEGTLVLMAFENGMYTITHSSNSSYSDISVGTYEILAQDEDEEPTSIGITETAYLADDGELKIVTNPRMQTVAVTDGIFAFTSTNGIKITFGTYTEEPTTPTQVKLCFRLQTAEGSSEYVANEAFPDLTIAYNSEGDSAYQQALEQYMQKLVALGYTLNEAKSSAEPAVEGDVYVCYFYFDIGSSSQPEEPQSASAGISLTLESVATDDKNAVTLSTRDSAVSATVGSGYSVYTWIIDGTAVETRDVTANLSGYSAGVHNITLTVVDAGGNYYSAQAVVIITSNE